MIWSQSHHRPPGAPAELPAPEPFQSDPSMGISLLPQCSPSGEGEDGTLAENSFISCLRLIGLRSIFFLTRDSLRGSGDVMEAEGEGTCVCAQARAGGRGRPAVGRQALGSGLREAALVRGRARHQPLGLRGAQGAGAALATARRRWFSVVLTGKPGLGLWPP